MKKLTRKSDMGKPGFDKDQVIFEMNVELQKQQKLIDQLIKDDKRNKSIITKLQSLIRTLKANSHTMQLEVNSIKNTLRKLP